MERLSPPTPFWSALCWPSWILCESTWAQNQGVHLCREPAGVLAGTVLDLYVDVRSVPLVAT